MTSALAVNNTRMVRRAAVASVLVGATSLFVYNSGYGYDALEYFVIGRSLKDGYPFYTFVPTKSWGIYSLVGAYLWLPFSDTHVGRTTLVIAVLALVCGVTYGVASRRFGVAASLHASILIGACALFTELNYLQPEGFVYLAGLLAFAAVTAAQAESRKRYWLVAGFCVGTGMAFKSVAAFYLLGLSLWMVGEAIINRRLQHLVSRLALVGVGFTAALAGPAIYFWSTGRWDPYVEWSYTFPLLHYPAHTYWIAKLYTKLLWVWIVILIALAAAIHPLMRSQIWGDSHVRLLLVLGTVPLITLLKTQASHYVFPGAAFLLLFSGVVWARAVAAVPTAARYARTVLVFSVVMAALSGWMYRPAALARFWSVRSYQSDRKLAEALQALVTERQRAIFLGGQNLYWLSGRYPSWEVVNTDVQTSHVIEHNAKELLKGLSDPRLAVVEFNPDEPMWDDPRFVDSRNRRAFVRDLECRLRSQFVRRDDLVPAMVLWIPARRPGAAPSAACPPTS